MPHRARVIPMTRPDRDQDGLGKYPPAVVPIEEINEIGSIIAKLTVSDKQAITDLNSDPETTWTLRMQVITANRAIIDGLKDGIIDKKEAERLITLPTLERFSATETLTANIGELITANRVIINALQNGSIDREQADELRNIPALERLAATRALINATVKPVSKPALRVLNPKK